MNEFFLGKIFFFSAFRRFSPDDTIKRSQGSSVFDSLIIDVSINIVKSFLKTTSPS